MTKSSARTALTAALAGGALCAFASHALADEVTTWNELLLTSIRDTSTGPPIASRAMAMTQLAVFEAVNSVDRNYAPYRGYYATPADTSKEAAAAQAAHDVLRSMYPDRAAVFAAQLTTSLNAISNSPAKSAGIELGRLAAAGMVAQRTGDGSALSVSVPVGTLPGQWRPTPSGNLPGAFGQYATVTPFGLTSPAQFRPAAPPSLASQAYADAVSEVRTLGSANSTIRTEDQTEIARVWAYSAGTITPPGAWNRVAQQVANTSFLTIDESARMFGLLGMAQADAAISSWDCKNVFNLWRPITAIHLADTDGNQATAADSDWTPLLTTPNFQGYTSGHSTFSSAAAAVLASIVGDSYSFTVTGAERTRAFTSFSAAAAEAGMSRIYGGIHFNFDNVEGLNCGRAVGEYAADNYLRVPAPASLPLLVGASLMTARRRRHG